MFGGQFKSVRVESSEQFEHVGRYIRINPFVGCLVKTLGHLILYQWSSLRLYLGEGEDRLVDREKVPELVETGERYRQFVQDQVGYQVRLESIKHLLFEEMN